MDSDFAQAKAALERMVAPVPDSLVHSLLAVSARYNKSVEDVLLAVGPLVDAKRKAAAFNELRKIGVTREQLEAANG